MSNMWLTDALTWLIRSSPIVGRGSKVKPRNQPKSIFKGRTSRRTSGPSGLPSRQGYLKMRGGPSLLAEAVDQSPIATRYSFFKKSRDGSLRLIKNLHPSRSSCRQHGDNGLFTFVVRFLFFFSLGEVDETGEGRTGVATLRVRIGSICRERSVMQTANDCVELI
ncbi:hypothetical protein BGY98DRAFT_1036069 [Russula aff. rugulosa BPL654]|nr:hypothetical protein BGY98DRAFT_1036069 [Russula aff. rugulosa BPL654]